MQDYFRPIPMTDPARPGDAHALAGGWCWFDRAERMGRDGRNELVHCRDLPTPVLDRLTAPRAPVAGIGMDRPRIMGILNVTPDSFSDGGQFNAPDAAIARARRMAQEGAEILDIGGESTRPGAEFVPAEDEIARTAPLIAALSGQDLPPVSIDTRKAAVAQAALDAGAVILNDVAAMTHDPAMGRVAADNHAPICLMHAQGDPKTMQDAPSYDDVVLDVYDFLAERIAAAMACGVPRERIIVDPGIGFGKTAEHNLRLLQNLSVFHGLGCPILLGASRKRFIGVIGNAPEPADRMPGSVAVALCGMAQGVQIVRVHDIQPTKQAVRLWLAATKTRA